MEILAVLVFITIFMCVIGFAYYNHKKVWREKTAIENMPAEEKEKFYLKQRSDDLRQRFGELSPVMICPHCQLQGKVRTKKVTRKKGVSGSKAAGALLTGGISLLATGLSRKEIETQAHCDNCNNSWYF